MLPTRDCYKPKRNSMAEFVRLPQEYVRQKELQRRDTDIEPYDIFNYKGAALPECLTAMDYIVGKWDNLEKGNSA